MRVFVIGVGVAGLQAIATAKRLGARVEAFDTKVFFRAVDKSPERVRPFITQLTKEGFLVRAGNRLKISPW